MKYLDKFSPMWLLGLLPALAPALAHADVTLRWNNTVDSGKFFGTTSEQVSEYFGGLIYRRDEKVKISSPYVAALARAKGDEKYSGGEAEGGSSVIYRWDIKKYYKLDMTTGTYKSSELSRPNIDFTLPEPNYALSFTGKRYNEDILTNDFEIKKISEVKSVGVFSCQPYNVTWTVLKERHEDHALRAKQITIDLCLSSDPKFTALRDAENAESSASKAVTGEEAPTLDSSRERYGYSNLSFVDVDDNNLLLEKLHGIPGYPISAKTTEKSASTDEREQKEIESLGMDPASSSPAGKLDKNSILTHLTTTRTAYAEVVMINTDPISKSLLEPPSD
jgi:hypothetical protein